MKELHITPLELKMLIDNSKMLGRGDHGTVFEYGNRLIKLDKTLYSLLRSASHPSLVESLFYSRYGISSEGLVNPQQIATLASKQKDITLTRLPEGIVNVDGFTPGVIIPYHRDHQALENLPVNDYKTLLVLLRKLLLAVSELADNQICQKDLAHFPIGREKKEYNILFQGDTPQIIDLSGDFVKCGDSFTDAVEMYRSLGDVILGYFHANNIPIDVSFMDITDAKKAGDLLNELEARVRGGK